MVQLNHRPPHTRGEGADRERGATLIIFTLMLVALLTIAALVIDIGFARMQARHVQGSVDASALAGAQDLPRRTDDVDYGPRLERARNRAMAYMARNISDNGDLPVPSACAGANPCVRTIGGSTITVTAPYALAGGATAHRYIRVHECAPSPTFFGGVAGRGDGQSVCRAAVARRRTQVANFGTGLMSLNPTRCASMAFGGNSNTDLVISGNRGAIIVNSDCEPNALDGGGTSWDVEAGEILVVGGYQITPCSVSGCLGGTTPVSGVDPFVDPFAGLVEPPKPSPGVCDTATRVCSPGYYGSGISIRNGSWTFLPGLYWIDGGLALRGGTLTAKVAGVTFFVKSGALDLNGNARLVLPPAPSGPYSGISFFQARTNTAEAKINGTSGSSIGTVYLPAAHLQVQGNAGPGDGPFVTGSVVSDTVTVTGNGKLTIFVPDDVPEAESVPDLGLER